MVGPSDGVLRSLSPVAAGRNRQLTVKLCSPAGIGAFTPAPVTKVVNATAAPSRASAHAQVLAAGVPVIGIGRIIPVIGIARIDGLCVNTSPAPAQSP